MLALAGGQAHTGDPAVLHQDVRGGGQLGKGGVGLGGEVIVHGGQYAAGVLRAQVPHRAGHQADIVAAGFVGDLLHLFIIQAVDFLGCAKAQVQLVGLMDQLLRLWVAQVFADVAAHLVGKGELAVRKGARPGPAVDNSAGVAVHTLARGTGRAGAMGNGTAHVHDENLAFRLLGGLVERS